jgi:hypothetical protein
MNCVEQEDWNLHANSLLILWSQLFLKALGVLIPVLSSPRFHDGNLAPFQRRNKFSV